jgi:hypothetical protein
MLKSEAENLNKEKLYFWRILRKQPSISLRLDVDVELLYIIFSVPVQYTILRT